jgi:hypothetical protein
MAVRGACAAGGDGGTRVSEAFANWSTDHALLVHGYLLGFAVFSTAVVAAGIIWETGPLEVGEVATKLVIWGVAAEAICTVALFVFDEGISSSQQSKILALETRLAARIITNDAANRIAAKMEKFEGQEYSGMVASDVGDAWELWREFSVALESAHWRSVPPPGQAVTQFGPPASVAIAPQPGVMILYAGSRFVDLDPRAKALAAAITAEGVAAGSGPASGATDQHPNAILIVIGPKPQ